MTRKHQARCQGCKSSLLHLLTAAFGPTQAGWRSGWPCREDDVRALPVGRLLSGIHKRLVAYRDFARFVEARSLPACDYYVDADPPFIVELDEKQHFTAARLITLRGLPRKQALGFDRDCWKELCRKIDAHDNQPPYRDEQRAWYDVLRDVLPTVYGMGPTIRFLDQEVAFCEMNAGRSEDVARFRGMVMKKAPSFPTRFSVATVCLKGRPLRVTTGKAMEARCGLLQEVVNKATCKCDQGTIDAIVFPGGFFRMADFVGDRTYAERVKALQAQKFAQKCRKAAGVLHKHSPGAILVVGIDSADRKHEAGDQLCVGWNSKGVAGIGRKVFPVKPVRGDEANEPERYVVTAQDFDDPHRIVPLPSGRRAILCACYDGFGISDPEKRARKIQRLRVGGRIIPRNEDGFNDALSEGISKWKSLVASASSGLIAIHRFGSGNSSMWQRHGISTASAKLIGGLVAAGTHFTRLPRSCDNQTLTSAGVPAEHLRKGWGRQGCVLPPFDHFQVHEALVRCFSTRPVKTKR